MHRAPTGRESAMTDIWDEIAEDLTNDSDLTVAAVFTPAVGDPVSLNVDVSTGTDFQPGGLDVQAWGTETTLEYLLSDIGREVNKGETFTVGGTVYTVQDVERNDGLFVMVNVK